MNDFLAVAVGKRVCHLADVQGRLGLGKPDHNVCIWNPDHSSCVGRSIPAVLLFLKTLVELPARCILQNEVNPGGFIWLSLRLILLLKIAIPALVVEITKQPKNIWVAKMGLDLNLSAKLVLYLQQSSLRKRTV